jgi:hypothetical protein
VTPVDKDAGVNDDGNVKFFGSQSSIKNPIVVANVGSTWGAIVVVSVGLGGVGAGVFFFSQEEKETTMKKAFIIKEIQALEIIGDLFIIFETWILQNFFKNPQHLITDIFKKKLVHNRW